LAATVVLPRWAGPAIVPYRAPVAPTTLRPVAATFLLFGAFWGAWAVSAADIEHGLRFSHGAFGLLLSAALVGAAFTNAAAGALTERWGTAPVLTGGLLLWGGLLALGAGIRWTPLFAFMVVTVVTSGGAIEVVMNVASAAALADQPGRLVRFHALWNIGGAAGAIAAGGLLRAGLSWRWVWLLVGLGAFVVAAVSRRAVLPAGDAGGHHSLLEGVRAVRAERLVLLSVAFATAAMIEGGIDTWGVLYLRRHLASGLLLGAGAAALGYGVAAVARVTLGPAAGSAGASRGIAIGALLASAGLLTLSLASAPVAAAAGLAVAAMGISVCWPMFISAASAGRDRPALVVGGMSAIGYVGLVVGPALVGLMAGTLGLQAGLVTLAVASLVVAVASAGATTGRLRSMT
jgi:predicted MFS family arabinose efflux permease